jgi:transcriptional regulator with XRE-family HTH domain
VAVTVTIGQLGSELRRRRKELGLSLRDASGASDISAATLSRIERGATPDMAVVGKLATWLGINVSAAGEKAPSIRTDEDLKRTIAVHLRATKNLSEKTASTIIESFDVIMRMEIEKAKRQKSKGTES